MKCLNRYPGYSDNNIQLIVNIDGLPLLKSSQIQLWPILGSFGNLDVFIIALFCGSSKPNSVEQYLFDFIDEVKKLDENGISHNGRKYRFSIKTFVCDAPARSFLKCTVGHTGYYSCERCIVKRMYVSNRVVFNEFKSFI